MKPSHPHLGRSSTVRRLGIVALAMVLAPVVAPVRAAVPAATCPVGAIVVKASDPAAVVLAELAAPGRGRVFCWEAGVHRIDRPMKLHPGDSFVGLTDPVTGRRAVIQGSRRVTGWTQLSARRWVASVPGLTVPTLNLPPGLRCLDGTDHCAYPDDVYWRNGRLRRVWSLGALGPRSYFVDYAGERIYIGADPRRGTVSRAVPLPVVDGRSTPFIQVQPGGAVRDLVVREVGVGMQGAAISGKRCVVEGVNVSLAHGRGIGVDDLSTVSSSDVHGNGQGGIGIGRHVLDATGPSGVVSGNTVYGNGWIRCLGICAGIKASSVMGLSIVDNVVENTVGTGIWIDNDSIGFRISGNTVTSSRTAGIEVEISYDGVIDGNTVTGTGLRPLQPGSVGAIHVLASGACSLSCPAGTGEGLVISNNTVGTAADPNAFGVVLRQMDRGSGPYGEHLVRGVTVRGNQVVLLRGWTGAVDPAGATGIYDAGNSFASNAYTVPTADAAVFRWRSSTGQADAWLTFVEWQAQGNDVDGSLTAAGQPAPLPSASTSLGGVAAARA